MSEKINYQAAIEAVLFAGGEPVPVPKLAEIIGIETAACRQQIDLMKKVYQKSDMGITILELNDSVQLATKDEYAEYVKRAAKVRQEAPLSQAAMEILAIIAYNEPVTKSFVEQVRGVDSSQTINMLCERGLLKEAGRLNLPGRPVAFRTTLNFLRVFGFKSLEELPKLADEDSQVKFSELLQRQNEE